MAVSEQKNTRQTSLEYILLGETIDKDGNEVDLLVVSELRKRDNFRMQRREGQKGRSLRPSPRELKLLYRDGNIKFSGDGETHFRDVMAQLNVDLDSEDAPIQKKQSVQKAKRVHKAVVDSGQLDSLTVAKLCDMVRDMGGSIYANGRKKTKTALIETIKELQSETDDTVPEAKPRRTPPRSSTPATTPVSTEKDIPVPSSDVAGLAPVVNETIATITDSESEIDASDGDGPIGFAGIDELSSIAPDVTDDSGDSEGTPSRNEEIDDANSDDLSMFEGVPEVPVSNFLELDDVSDLLAIDVKPFSQDWVMPSATSDDGSSTAEDDNDENQETGFVIMDADFGNDVIDAPVEEGASDGDYDHVEVQEEVAPEVTDSQVARGTDDKRKRTSTILFNIPSDDDEKIALADGDEELAPYEDAFTHIDSTELIAAADEESLPEEESLQTVSEASDNTNIHIWDHHNDDLLDDDTIKQLMEIRVPEVLPGDEIENENEYDFLADDFDDLDDFYFDEPFRVTHSSKPDDLVDKTVDAPSMPETASTFIGDDMADLDEIDSLEEEPEQPQPSDTNRSAPVRRRIIPQRRQGVAVADLGSNVTPIASKISLGNSDFDIGLPTQETGQTAFDTPDIQRDEGNLADAFLFESNEQDTSTDESDTVSADENLSIDDDMIAVKDEETDLIDIFEDLDNEGIKTSEDLMGAFYTEAQADENPQPEPALGYSGFDFVWSDKSAVDEAGDRLIRESDYGAHGNTEPSTVGFGSADYHEFDDLDDDLFDLPSDGANGDSADIDEAAYGQYDPSDDVAEHGVPDGDGEFYEIPDGNIVADDDTNEAPATDGEDSDAGRENEAYNGYPVSTGTQRGLNEQDRKLVRRTFRRMLIAILIVAAIAVAGIVWLMSNGTPIFPSISLP